MSHQRAQKVTKQIEEGVDPKEAIFDFLGYSRGSIESAKQEQSSIYDVQSVCSFSIYHSIGISLFFFLLRSLLLALALASILTLPALFSNI